MDWRDVAQFPVYRYCTCSDRVYSSNTFRTTNNILGLPCWRKDDRNFTLIIHIYLMVILAIHGSFLHILFNARWSLYLLDVWNYSWRKIQQDATMYQNFIILYLYEAQHVSGDTPPIIRSLKLQWQPLVFHTWKVVGRVVGGTVCLTTSTSYTSNNLPRMKKQRLPVQF